MSVPAPSGAVYDRGYRPYDGPRGGRGAALAALVRLSVRRALGLRRSWRQKVFPWSLLAIATIPAIVNVGMVLGVLPVIGIPLPLISYGGSALVPTMVALGLLVNFAKTESGAKRALAARRRSPRRTAQSPRRR